MQQKELLPLHARKVLQYLFHFRPDAVERIHLHWTATQTTLLTRQRVSMEINVWAVHGLAPTGSDAELANLPPFTISPKSNRTS